MGLFNLGPRNILGVTLPGAIVVLALIYCVLSIHTPDWWQSKAIELAAGQGILLLVVGFVITYVIGSLIRLYAADSVDRLSAWSLNNRNRGYPGPFPKLGEAEAQLQRVFEEVVEGLDAAPWPVDKIRWVWGNDQFPYPVWEFMKFRLYHPPEMFRFYVTYRGCFGTAERRGKEFLNYCKMVVYNSSRLNGDALGEEVQGAEGMSRFFAGTFYASVVSGLTLLCCGVFQLIRGDHYWETGPTLVFSLAALLTAWLTVRNGRFRLVRLKEVDTVFDAFYLVHRHIDECARCTAPRAEVHPEGYEDREKLLRDAFSAQKDGAPTYGPIVLDRLVAMMKDRSATNALLSSLYFAGARGDHPYFLKNDRIALGLAVLPQDEAKSSIPKRHPHQSEVIFVVEGSLRLRVEEGGKMDEKILEQGQVYVIGPGRCHCITGVNGRSATYLFVKTNPVEEPREEQCRFLVPDNHTLSSS